MAPSPLLPEYGGACLSSLVPALLGNSSSASASPAWLPEAAWGAAQLVLLVLDGLGWTQLQAHRDIAPVLASMAGGAITSVAPTTTATALTSITTGLTPAEHGVVGYRVRVAPSTVMNVLRWRTAHGDARREVHAASFQPTPAFLGTRPPVVTRSEFAKTGFTAAHLAGSPLHGWRLASALPIEVGRRLAAGDRFVYAYYDGVDKVAHERGFGDHYDAELAFVDRLVDLVRAQLPPGAVLLVTADHGQVQVDANATVLDGELMADVEMLSGEGRFRWLHVREGTAQRVVDRAERLYGDVAWVRTRRQVVEEGWLGGIPSPTVDARLGDVALVAFEPVAFDDPADTGETRLVCRHGSLTPDESLVPLLAADAC